MNEIFISQWDDLNIITGLISIRLLRDQIINYE